MNDSLNNKELVAAGHEFAKTLSSDTAIIDIAKMVARLAERLDCTTAALREMSKQRDALASQKAAPIILYRERNPYNGLATGWEELNAQEYGFVKDNASDNAEFRIVYTAPPAPVVPDDGRAQFEEWFKFHHGDEHSIVTLRRANGGANYLDPHVDLAWIAWKDSRAAMLQEISNEQ
ncbi:hypothetical protein [Escherichia coli]|uniref:hypothetical protein n=1 Tax=Escherichia coli TaxID=562 RepID=UPI0010CAD8B9|nr:hypothetical protein [Escherichia coli]EFE7960320.1 hypothetical protein [Escherichia coli]GCV57794.1 putative phage protein [Escherichia coli]